MLDELEEKRARERRLAVLLDEGQRLELYVKLAVRTFAPFQLGLLITTSSMTALGTLYQVTTSSFKMRTPPDPIAPMASSR